MPNCYLWFAVFAAAFGSGCQHGYNTGVLNTPQDVIKKWIIESSCRNSSHGSRSSSDCLGGKEATWVWAMIVSAFALGGIIGGALTGPVAAIIGRKKGLLWNNGLVFVATMLMSGSYFTDSKVMLILGRLIIGVNSGINAGVASMYLNEISSTDQRGLIGSVYQLVVTVSITASQLLGMNAVLGTAAFWPLLLAVTLLPTVVQISTLSFCVESPKFLLLDRKDEVSAREALIKLRGTDNVEEEMNEMLQEQETKHEEPDVTFKMMVTERRLQIPLGISITMMLSQQLTGIGAAIFYSTKIFRLAGLSVITSQVASVIMGLFNVAMTVLSLLVVDKCGRKLLMMMSLSGMCICTCVLLAVLYLGEEAAYVAISSVIGFVVFFALGTGSIPWFLVTELFSQGARPIATSIANGCNWGANFFVSLLFPLIEAEIRQNVFIIFIVIQISMIIFIFFVVPETKGKSVEEITAIFSQGKN